MCARIPDARGRYGSLLSDGRILSPGICSRCAIRRPRVQNRVARSKAHNFGKGPLVLKVGMRKVLVTGASGFIGRQALLPLIEKGFEVHGTYLNEPLKGVGNVEWHKVDLLDLESTNIFMRTLHATHLLHFAWYAVPGQYWTSAENMRWKEATLALLTMFGENGGVRATLAGTCAEYDWTHGQDILSENSSIKPATLYGKSKHETHLWAEKFSEKNGISLAWGRIFYLYGPCENSVRLVPSVINSLLDNKPALATTGEQILDFLHVEDVASAFAKLLDSNVTGPVNIASGTGVAVRDVVLSIADIMEKRDLVRLGAKQRNLHEPARIVADAKRLQKEVCWNPKYDLATGLQNTILWWQANKA